LAVVTIIRIFHNVNNERKVAEERSGKTGE